MSRTPEPSLLAFDATPARVGAYGLMQRFLLPGERVRERPSSTHGPTPRHLGERRRKCPEVGLGILEEALDRPLDASVNEDASVQRSV